MTTGPYHATHCACGQRGCHDWHVEPTAAVQGVGFNRAEAVAIAELLNRRSGYEDQGPPQIAALDIDAGTARVIDEEANPWMVDCALGAQALVEAHLEAVESGAKPPNRRAIHARTLSASSIGEDSETQHLAELERHGVTAKRHGCNDTISVYTLPERLAALEPHANWVRDAIEQPERTLECILRAMAARTTIATHEIVAAVWNDTAARKTSATPAQDNAQVLRITLEGGLVAGIDFPDTETAGRFNVVVEDYDIEGADEDETTRSLATGRRCWASVWRAPQGMASAEPVGGETPSVI